MSALTARRGQTSLELLPFVGLGLLLLIMFVALIAQRSVLVQDQGAYEALQNIVYSINQEIRTASTVTDGYTRRFEVPLTARGKQYNLSIVQPATITASEDGHEASLQTLNVTGQPAKGWNTITKNNGIIKLN